MSIISDYTNFNSIMYFATLFLALGAGGRVVLSIMKDVYALTIRIIQILRFAMMAIGGIVRIIGIVCRIICRIGHLMNSPSKFSSPFPKGRRPPKQNTVKRLERRVYQTADAVDAFRAMVRGEENSALMGKPKRQVKHGPSEIEALQMGTPTNQSILVSGESGAGKTVTTEIVLNYFTMLSMQRVAADGRGPQSTPSKSPRPNMDAPALPNDNVSIEQQVLHSNPILESFGNVCIIRNDNSSRFGKHIDISFTQTGKLSGASIKTYQWKKVRLIHPLLGERNYHIFYQFLMTATAQEHQDFFFGNKSYQDFSGTSTRRDGVSDDDHHFEMLDAMVRHLFLFQL